jgi:NTE family protein
MANENDTGTEVVLLMQGGGALGAFQAGAWETLAPFLRERGLPLAAVAGASIGALNAALIARHCQDEDRGAGVPAAFWRGTLARQAAPLLPLPGPYWAAWNGLLSSLLFGNPAMFAPQYENWNPLAALARFGLPPYDTAPVLATLERAFGRYRGNAPLLAIGATDVRTGESHLFDSVSRHITPELIAASMAVPMLFPSVEIDGDPHWDYDARTNSLLPAVFDLLRAQQRPRRPRRLLVIVLDMFAADAGGVPQTEMETTYRLMNIMLGNKLRFDRREFDAANAHLASLDRLAALAADAPDTPLARAVEAELRQAIAERLGHVEFLHINRQPLAFEHVSRDFDYRPAYLEALIEQGRTNAAAALRDYAARETAPPPARSRPFLAVGTAGGH